MALDIKIYDTEVENTWCPGCGNFSILKSLKTALSELEIYPKDVMLVSGIGQAAKTPHYINVNGINGLHGRGLPAAMGAKLANKDMNVIVVSGDGDGYGEGGNHLIHNIRRNLDMVHLIHNNQIYGLTKGQGSPTTALNQKTTLQVDGMRVEPLNPIALAISMGCSFVARSFSGDQAHLKEMIKQAINHNGYAIIDIMQPCISFNKINTFKWYKDRVYKVDENHNPYDKIEAFKLSQIFGDEGIPIGVIYKEDKSSFIDKVEHLKNGEALLNVKREPRLVESFYKDFL